VLSLRGFRVWWRRARLRGSRPPVRHPFPKVCSTEAALKTRMSAGYRPEKYLGAWREVFKRYAALFPNQYVSLALYRGLAIALRNRAPVADDAEVRETAQRVIAEGMTELAGKFAVEANRLVANSPRNMAYQLVRSSGGRSVTGFELATASTKRPEVEGDAGNRRGRSVFRYAPDWLPE
jgi:hypothetical protein